MEPLDALGATDFVIFRDGSQEVTGVREFHIAKALLEGRSEELNRTISSQWGPVSMIELCLRFGHCDTALAVAQHTSSAYTVQSHHLGPYAQGRNGEYHRPRNPCECRSLQETCKYCCFGWPVDHGTWMADWDAGIKEAVQAAEEATAHPFLYGLLEMSRGGAQLPLLSAEGMARLLDIAILIGDKEAAARVSRNCQVWPLRRWIGRDLFESVAEDFAKYSKVLIAALHVGADLESVQVSLKSNEDEDDSSDMPLRVALFLRLEISQWQQLEEFLQPNPVEWGPDLGKNQFARYFLCPDGSSHKLCISKIRSIDRAAVDISRVGILTFPGWDIYGFVSNLLGMAILLGQSDCAIACVWRGMEAIGSTNDEGISISSSIRSYLDGEDVDSYSFLPEEYYDISLPIAAALDCRSVACAAGRAAVRRAWENGVAIYQLMTKMFGGRPFPMELVHSIVIFSVRVPEFVDELGLFDLVEGWMLR